MNRPRLCQTKDLQQLKIMPPVAPKPVPADRARSENMRAIKSKDTRPELAARKLIHAMGYRFRLHRTDMPGKPDLVFPSRRKVILVHGCFWHGHDCPRGSVAPKRNADYWRQKIARNIARDAHNLENLQQAGWNVLVIWECQTLKRHTKFLEEKIRSFLR